MAGGLQKKKREPAPSSKGKALPGSKKKRNPPPMKGY